MKTESIMPALEQVVNFFREDCIDAIAKETGFSLRKRKLSALVFLGIFTFGLIQKADATLVQLVSLAKCILPSLDITPQGLHKRINDKAVAFLIKMFAKSLCLSIDPAENLLPLFSGFEKVNLLDTTQVTLPQEVADQFAAAGGSSSKAGAKIQLMVDYQTGSFSYLDLTDAVSPDQTLIPTIHPKTKPSELWIFDLGCCSQDNLKALADHQAFFLCRLITQTALFEKNEAGELERLDLAQLVTSLRPGSINDLQIVLGAKAQVPCRLIIEPLAAEVFEQRKRRLKQKARKKGRTPSQKQLALCRYNFHLTNVSKEVFAPSAIRQIYRLRWQIELVFKAIKSHLGFELIAGKREARIECQLYGRLISLVISLFLTGQFRQHLWKTERRQLSLLKSFAHLPIVAPTILNQLRHPQRLLATLLQVASEIIRLCRMDSRKTRRSTVEILLRL
jgi:hypothetical protein